jgi:hypothetical protein
MQDVRTLEPRFDNPVYVIETDHGSACGPVIVPVFKTGGWQAILSPVGSTPTRFRHLFQGGKRLSIRSQSETWDQL